MAKRLSRFNTADTIRKALPTLIDKKINIVTTDGRVLYVLLNKFEDGERLHYQNMRRKHQEMSLNQIAEIIYDY